MRLGSLLCRHCNHHHPSSEFCECEGAKADRDKLLQDALAAANEKPRKKGVYVGAPACFALELACKHINAAFGGFGCYLVGSALERPDWRDIDVRFIMKDEEFDRLFPGTLKDGIWEFDARWLLLTVSISEHLRRLTGLPVDFQFQPQTHANERHKGMRNALGLRFAKEELE